MTFTQNDENAQNYPPYNHGPLKNVNVNGRCRKNIGAANASADRIYAVSPTRRPGAGKLREETIRGRRPHKRPRSGAGGQMADADFLTPPHAVEKAPALFWRAPERASPQNLAHLAKNPVISSL
jgi:hypothetical protein